MRPKKILLAEDNPDDELLTTRALKKCGVLNEVDVVHNGQDVIDYLECKGKYSNRNHHEMPQLVLLDLKMPVKDGLEALEYIRSRPRLKTLPVVILTSSREESDLISGYELGVNSIVCKPINFEEFSEAVRHLGMYWLLMNEYPAI